MVAIYDKLEKIFVGYKDLGVAAKAIGRPKSLLDSAKLECYEDERYIIGVIDIVKSRRGGIRTNNFKVKGGLFNGQQKMKI